MEAVFLLFGGASFYFSSFLITEKTLVRLFREKLSHADVVLISEKIVNGIQGVMSVIVGIAITSRCHTDILYSSCWLTNAYIWFGLPYFVYDLVVMYKGHTLVFPAVQDLVFVDRVQHFVVHNKLLTLHHSVLPLIFCPVVLLFRKGLGDFFIGIFFQFELCIPFIAARNIMVQLQLKHTPLYVVVGLSMILTFFISRILVFPYMYWHYAVYVGIPTWTVPTIIPIKCSVGCVIILSFQLYWMSKMLKGVVKLIYKITACKTIHSEPKTSYKKYISMKMS